ncbi:MAG: molybdopterin-dependent oxidoreductase, partial [Gammaproteobacteria bacterium]|nr:molybdopterin-dependent oxidoreductase [Gammaproteobacteria bacterium]
VLAATVAADPVFFAAEGGPGTAAAAPLLVTGEYPADQVETAGDIIYSVCQMCHSRCGIRAKVIDGILVKIDGNPWHPNQRDVDENNAHDRLAYRARDPDTQFHELGRVCLKGQAGVQTVYDPYRIQHPLKRVGPRGSGQWQTISWDQAFAEIAQEIKRLIPNPREPIDPANPVLGPKANQLVFSPGRSVEKELSNRIWRNGWGTINYNIDHTSICEASRHVAGDLITWNPDPTDPRKGAGRTVGWQADILGAEFLVYWGANPLEADFPMVGLARNLMQFKENGGRYVVVDPRQNNTAAKANGVPARNIPPWVPIIPGGDAALALGMMSWILEQQRYDVRYLTNPNQAAAAADGEPTWTDSTYLVGTFTDAGGQAYQRYVTAGELGIIGAPPSDYVVMDGVAKGHSQTAAATLEVNSTLTIGGRSIIVKSAFTLLKESVNSRTRAQYSAICGVSIAVMEALAQELVSHGKKAAVITYRGAVKHTNGFYNQLAIQHLNTLIGNYDWKGGCTAGAGGLGGQASGVVSLGKVEGDPGAKGIRIDRAMSFYEEAGPLFTGYPAKRPWFPFGTQGNYQELIPSIEDGYPYPIKVLMTYWNALPYSVPGLRQVWERVMAEDALPGAVPTTAKVPLFVAISPVMGEVAAWADYILPDSTYLEKFSVPGIPWRVNKGTAFQRPVVGAFDGAVIGSSAGIGNRIPRATNDYTPALPDTKAVADIHIGLAKALGLPGVGSQALHNADGTKRDLHNAWDWAKAMLDNIAFNANSKYPGLTPDEIIAKGGVFDNPGEEYTVDGKLAYRYGNIIRLFADPVARTRDSVTGQYYSGVPHYQGLAHSDGAALNDGAGFPLKLITFKVVHHGQGRTNVNPWLMLMSPENYVELSAADASRLGIQTGDPVRVSSASYTAGVVGKAKVTQGLMPGVVAISHHFGHWEQGARPHVINGVQTGFDPSRGAGIHPGTVMRRDRRSTNVSLQDPIGASASFYDTWVKVSRV